MILKEISMIERAGSTFQGVNIKNYTLTKSQFYSIFVANDTSNYITALQLSNGIAIPNTCFNTLRKGDVSNLLNKVKHWHDISILPASMCSFGWASLMLPYKDYKTITFDMGSGNMMPAVLDDTVFLVNREEYGDGKHEVIYTSSTPFSRYIDLEVTEKHKKYLERQLSCLALRLCKKTDRNLKHLQPIPLPDIYDNFKQDGRINYSLYDESYSTTTAARLCAPEFFDKVYKSGAMCFATTVFSDMLDAGGSSLLIQMADGLDVIVLECEDKSISLAEVLARLPKVTPILFAYDCNKAVRMYY